MAISIRHIWRLNAAKLPPLAPQNTAPPAVVGVPLLGSTLSVDEGSWIDSVTPAAKKFFLGVEFGASTDGLNGGNGFQSGSYEERILEEGTFEIVLANTPGADAASHLDRFLILATPKRFSDATSSLDIYRPGDEWIEIWDENQLLFIGTPTRPVPGRNQISIKGSDPTFLLKKNREFWAGYWNHAPRDVWEHYTSVWQAVIADDFQDPAFTFGTGTSTTSDNRWAYTRAQDGPASTLRIAPGASATVGRVRATDNYAFAVGLNSSGKYNAWRVETEFTRVGFGNNAYVRVGIWDKDASVARAYIQFQENYTTLVAFDDITNAIRSTDAKTPTDPPGPFQVVVEGRERWIYFFVNQTLYGIIAMPEGPYNCVPYVEVKTGTSPYASVYADFRQIVCRRTVQYLMNGTLHGDRHLNAPLPAGGLNARYFDDRDLQNAGSYGVQVFNPANTNMLALRQEGPLDFNSTGGDWWPQGTADGLWWSVRWTGAIKLNLASTDYLIRYTTAQEGARLWVGKTRRGEEYLDNWLVNLGGTRTGTSVRTHIGTDDDGAHHDAWYPILIEYGQRGTAGAQFKLEYSVNGGSSWSVVPVDALSPYGIFQDLIRLDSHSEVLRTLQDTFSLQALLEPRPMEHDAFPGEFVPRNRVGRDTNKVIDAIEALDYSTDINAEGVADTLFADGSGIADQGQAAQVTLEAIQFDGLEQRLMVMSEYESFGDITDPVLLDQRINSLLALYASPWEEVNAAPATASVRKYIDAFPMTGTLAEFFWRPGDGVRISIPEIGVMDGSPRQILGVNRSFVPEGLGVTVASFRQRPRNLREYFRQIQRRIATKQRNYQGQIVRTTGTAAALGTPSILPLPANLSDVAKAEVVMLTVPAAPLYVYVNGVKTNLPAIETPGTYDITAYVARYLDNTTTTPTMRVELKTS